jgi:ABC-type dipeptide/oligopeptide/nickel transport system permease subunit
MRNYKKTIIGSAILLLLLLASLLYSNFAPMDFNQLTLITDSKGNVIDRAPFPPSNDFWIGTDRNGKDILLLLLYGAKFTLITAFGVALLRVLLGGIFGIFLSMWAPFLKKYFGDFFLVFRYIPSVLIGIILMLPIVGGFTDVAISSIVTYQMIILVFIGFPSVAIFTSDLMDELLKTTFVKSSFLMGASKFHIVRKQLMPFIRSYGILFFVQQILSTFQITMHLGIFGFFLGGLDRGGVLGFDQPEKKATLSNEWAGLIGQNFHDFVLIPWSVFGPVLGFFFVIFIVNMIKKELEENISGMQVVKKKRKKNREVVAAPVSAMKRGMFDFVHKL